MYITHDNKHKYTKEHYTLRCIKVGSRLEQVVKIIKTNSPAEWVVFVSVTLLLYLLLLRSNNDFFLKYENAQQLKASIIHREKVHAFVICSTYVCMYSKRVEEPSDIVSSSQNKIHGIHSGNSGRRGVLAKKTAATLAKIHTMQSWLVLIFRCIPFYFLFCYKKKMKAKWESCRRHCSLIAKGSKKGNNNKIGERLVILFLFCNGLLGIIIM